MDYGLKNAAEVRHEIEEEWLDFNQEMNKNEIFEYHLRDISAEIAERAHSGKCKLWKIVEYRYYRPICEYLRKLGYKVYPDFEHRKIKNIFKSKAEWDFDLKSFNGDIYFTIKW